jgi:hypothetical protein
MASEAVMAKRRFDRYDYIGMAIVVFLIALWVAHFVLPDTGPAAPV